MTRICWNLAGLCGALLLSVAATSAARAQDYTVEALKDGPPSENVAREITETLNKDGIRVKRGDAPFADIWLRKEWPAQADFKPTNEIRFPFQTGELMGLVRYHTKAQDFRGQDIKPGIYTLRFALQPVDGNHVGTSDTRDFYLLVTAAEDRAPAAIEEKALWKVSAKSIGTTHPAMLVLRKPVETPSEPTLKHHEEAEQWGVVFSGTPQGGQPNSLATELIVVGMAKE